MLAPVHTWPGRTFPPIAMGKEWPSNTSCDGRLGCRIRQLRDANTKLEVAECCRMEVHHVDVDCWSCRDI